MYERTNELETPKPHVVGFERKPNPHVRVYSIYPRLSDCPDTFIDAPPSFDQIEKVGERLANIANFIILTRKVWSVTVATCNVNGAGGNKIEVRKKPLESWEGLHDQIEKAFENKQANERWK